ncbi:hypothetical protein ABPG72_007184 [Tetrahymena utriculariae]
MLNAQYEKSTVLFLKNGYRVQVIAQVALIQTKGNVLPVLLISIQAIQILLLAFLNALRGRFKLKISNVFNAQQQVVQNATQTKNAQSVAQIQLWIMKIISAILSKIYLNLNQILFNIHLQQSNASKAAHLHIIKTKILKFVKKCIQCIQIDSSSTQLNQRVIQIETLKEIYYIIRADQCYFALTDKNFDIIFVSILQQDKNYEINYMSYGDEILQKSFIVADYGGCSASKSITVMNIMTKQTVFVEANLDSDYSVIYIDTLNQIVFFNSYADKQII